MCVCVCVSFYPVKAAGTMLAKTKLTTATGLKGKRSKGKAKDKIPPSVTTDTGADLGTMTLEYFAMWSPEVLKYFLTLRKKSAEGTFYELAAR